MTVLLDIPVVVDERAARADLRRQIARLEARCGTAPGTGRGPALLSLGELEAIRDALTARTSDPPAYEQAIWTFEAMVADPGAHRHTRIPLADLGLPGCGAYSVRPRLGLVGMLAGWWEITLSSGCP